MRPSINTILASLARAALLNLFTAAILFLPSVAAASEGETVLGVPRDIWDLILRIVNFTILFGLLFHYLRKPIVNAIRNSIDSIKKLLKEAEETRSEAEARMKEAEDKLAGVDKEISDLLTSARRESEAERERILAEAAEALEKLKGETSLAIEQELKKARDILKREAADAAVALAEEILSQKITPEDQSKFVEDYLQKLEANQ